MTLQTLYKSTKLGATQQCIISVTEDTFTVQFGQVDGKQQYKTTTCYPKNVGRANATTAEQQAIFEANAKHQKKRDTGYSTSLPDDVLPSDVVLLPQKVKAYQDQLHNIADFVYVSDKYDGVNGTYRLDGTELLLYSRGGLVYPPIPHIDEDMRTLMHLNDIDELNVELYIPDTHLQLIQSAVKKPNELSTLLQARIFEVPNHSGTYTAHREKLLSIRHDSLTPFIIIVPSDLIRKELIEDYFASAISRGCEGLIVRNPTGVYTHNQRSSDVFKYKVAQSAEFVIIGYKLDKDNYPILSCMSLGGPFDVRPKGDVASRINMLADIKSHIGKHYTVEYETMSLGNKPLKPVGIALRDMSASGEPLE